MHGNTEPPRRDRSGENAQQQGRKQDSDELPELEFGPLCQFGVRLVPSATPTRPGWPCHRFGLPFARCDANAMKIALSLFPARNSARGAADQSMDWRSSVDNLRLTG